MKQIKFWYFLLYIGCLTVIISWLVKLVLSDSMVGTHLFLNLFIDLIALINFISFVSLVDSLAKFIIEKYQDEEEKIKS